MKDPSFIASLINNQAQASPFSFTFFTDVATKLSPINWWKDIRFYGVPSDFLELVVKLLLCPASSVSIEWIFSNLVNIHAKVHNEIFWNAWVKMLLLNVFNEIYTRTTKVQLAYNEWHFLMIFTAIFSILWLLTGFLKCNVKNSFFTVKNPTLCNI